MTSDEFKIQVFSLKDKLFRFSKHILNDATEAEDVVQDVLIKLWKMKKELPKYKNLEALAMIITKNLSLDKTRRKNTRIQKAEAIAYEMEVVNFQPDFEKQETSEWIKKTIQNLGEPQKTIMYLRDVEGYDYKDIEPIVHLSVETIRVNLSRARKKVRAELQKRWNYGLAES